MFRVIVSARALILTIAIGIRSRHISVKIVIHTSGVFLEAAIASNRTRFISSWSCARCRSGVVWVVQCVVTILLKLKWCWLVRSLAYIVGVMFVLRLFYWHFASESHLISILYVRASTTRPYAVLHSEYCYRRSPLRFPPQQNSFRYAEYNDQSANDQWLIARKNDHKIVTSLVDKLVGCPDTVFPTIYWMLGSVTGHDVCWSIRWWL